MIFGFIIGFIYVLLDIVYWTKWTVTIILLWIQKKTTHRRFDLYDFEADYEPEKVGVVIPTEEKILESPFDEEHLQKAADEVFFYGANSKSQSMVVRISRSCNDESEAWIYLKLADGHWYELEETKGYQRNFTDKCTSFTCGGLQMYYLSPMRKWRISYCGMLKKRKSASDVEGKSVFVKFTFIWTASSDVYDASYDLDIQGAAAAVARAKWNSYLPPIDRIPKILDLYCQSGVLDGVVSIENEPDMEMYLFGERMRLTGESSYLAGGKYKHLVGVVPESGLVVHLARVSYPNTFEPFLFGFIVHPSSNVYIGKTALRMTRMDDVERRLIVKFTAGKDYLLRGHYVGEGLHFTSEHGWHGHLEMLGINFEIDDCKGTGFILMGENAAKPRDVNQKKIQNIPPSISTVATEVPISVESKAKPLTVYFTDEASHSSDLTGGKGSSLGKLTKLSKIMKSEFIVPKGIVVTTAAYDEFVTPEILQKIENLKDIVYGNIKGNIQEACKIVQIAIERAYLPDKITKEIETKLKTLFGENINTFKVAVRSSATGEDTDQMSAAGQMDTFLGVQGLKEIFTAVKKCWASQFGPIATEYKRRNGQILNSGMAVVIQEMVKCEAAGVLFTCDPVTNNPSVTVLTGNYGLGESVVSGSEEPDTIVLEKLPNDEMLIKSKLVGMKQHRIVLMDTKPSEDEEGTVLEEVPEDQRNSCCISDEMALKLGKLSRKIENYYKSPRDIEWGLKNNVIYMLQSRPITTGDTVSDYEIIHEFDAALKCEEEYYTKHNVGEVMPGATSPLGIDIVVKYFAMTFQKEKMKKMQGNNFLQSKYYQAGILSFYNHMHLGVADLIARIDDIDSKEAQSMMMGMFGRILDDPELKVLIKRKDYKKMKSSLSFKFNFLWGSAVTFKSIQRGLCTLLSSFGIQTKNMFFCGSTIEKVKDEVFNCKVKAENGKTAKEIFNLIVGACSDFTETFHNHMTCTEMSSFWNMLLFNVLQEAKKGVDNEVYADFAKLLASSSNVESADVPASMQDLAEAIVKEIKGEKFRAMPVEDALKWLETATCLAGYKYRQFIERHGHRCLKEFDVHSISWSRDPKSLVKLLQTMTISCEHVKEKKESDGLPNLSIPLNMKSRLLLKLILPNCRRGVREREACKSNMIKAIDNNRRGFHRLSQAMVAEGYLPDTDLMYFLTVDEIKDLLETRNPRLIARASHRRKVYPKLDALSFPDISKGRPVPLNEEQEEVEYVADLTMKGIPVSQGIVKGYARVARTLEEAANLKQGEILITNSTDIGWSPYFPIIGGVVTEIGGLISHGAVVSREYGLPCVVGLHGATRQFFTGDYVLLDGNKGILQRLSPPES